MNFVKRAFCIFLSVLILSISVGTTWFDSNHMEKVEASGLEVAAITLSAAAMYAICYYVGTVAYTYAPIETVDLPDEQIVATGYATIATMYASNELNIPGLNSAPVIGFVDKVGQSYLYGTEAFQEIAETELTVIMGGKKPDDDDNDDDDTSTDDQGGIVDNVVHMLGNVKELSACCSLALGGVLGSIIKDEYDKYMNGDGSIYDSIEDYAPITATDIKEQWSGAAYTASFQLRNTYTCKSPYESVTHSEVLVRWFDVSVDFPMAVYHYTSTTSDGVINHTLYPIRKSNSGTTSYWDNDYYSQWRDGKLIKSNEKGGSSLSWDITDFGTWDSNGNHNVTCSMSGSIPIFNDKASAVRYLLNNGEGYENALNYIKHYQVADWLSSDWSGSFLDPLTGLNALSNLSNIARHQGLNALGTEFDFSQFADFLRDYFANLGNDTLPEVDPAQAPIVYPVDSSYPEYTFDPSENPAIQPSTGGNPDIPIDPSIPIDPIPNPDSAYPIDDIVPDVSESLGDLCGNLRYKFPFSIPWDIQYMLSCLADTPKTPHFELPLVIVRFGINEMLIIDMSNLQMLSTLSRSMFSMLFAIYLINLTFKVVGMRKEE